MAALENLKQRLAAESAGFCDTTSARLLCKISTLDFGHAVEMAVVATGLIGAIQVRGGLCQPAAAGFVRVPRSFGCWLLSQNWLPFLARCNHTLVGSIVQNVTGFLSCEGPNRDSRKQRLRRLIELLSTLPLLQQAYMPGMSRGRSTHESPTRRTRVCLRPIWGSIFFFFQCVRFCVNLQQQWVAMPVVPFPRACFLHG